MSVTRPVRLSVWFGSLLALVILESLLAQSAPRPVESPRPDANDPIETLSPFVVNTNKDTGYQATSTLAGTRLNTPIKDLGAAISIYTKDFMDDIGATSANELLV